MTCIVRRYILRVSVAAAAAAAAAAAPDLEGAPQRLAVAPPVLGDRHATRVLQRKEGREEVDRDYGRGQFKGAQRRMKMGRKQAPFAMA